MTIADWNIIENFLDISNISFARLIVANFHYDLFGKLVEGFSLLLISDISKDPVVNTNYRQYNKLVAGLCLISDYNCYKKDAFDADKNNDEGSVDNRVADNRAVDNNHDQGEDNDQNSDGDYIEE